MSELQALIALASLLILLVCAFGVRSGYHIDKSNAKLDKIIKRLDAGGPDE